MVPFHVAAKRVVFGGPVLICRNVKEGTPGCIMLEVDTTSVAELVSLTPCTGAGSGTVSSGGTTSGGAAVDAAWGSRGWTDCYNRDLIVAGHRCCSMLDEFLEKDAGG